MDGLGLPRLPVPAKSGQLCSLLLELFYNGALSMDLLSVISEERPHCRLLELHKPDEQHNLLQ